MLANMIYKPSKKPKSSPNPSGTDKNSSEKKGDHEKLAEVHLSLKIVPRLGLLVILAIFLLMINAAHGALRG